MLYTKFRGNRYTDSVEEYFRRGLGQVAQMPRTNFRSSTTQHLALIGLVVSEKKMFAHFGRRRSNDRRRADAWEWVYYSFPERATNQVNKRVCMY